MVEWQSSIPCILSYTVLLLFFVEIRKLHLALNLFFLLFSVQVFAPVEMNGIVIRAVDSYGKWIKPVKMYSSIQPTQYSTLANVKIALWLFLW